MKRKLNLLFVAVATLQILLSPLVAEPPPPPPPPPGNPFGGGTQAPPPDFKEEDDFLDPGNSFGFQPPGGEQPTTPPPVQPPEETVTPPTVATPPPPIPGARPSVARPAVPAKPPTGTVTKVEKGASGPKLADYLELESSVKSLEVKNFDLPDKEIKDVVTLISKWTGKNFILDNKVRGKITIIGPSQVTLQEAYQAFLSALEANQLTTVQAGKFIRIIESGEARRAPVKTYTGEYAPKDDQFITRIIQLKYINADEVQREFRDLTTRQGKLFAYEPTNSIIVTDTGSNIQRMKELLETLDVKNFETTLHVLRIRNTSAKTISDMLGEIYGEGKGGGTGQPRSFRKSALERTRGGGIITKIIPDEATNSLVVLANQSGFESLRKLVDKLDVKVTDTGRIHVYYCEYAKAEDLAQTLASLASGNSGRTSSRRNTTVSTAPGAPPTPGGGSAGPVSAELEGGIKVTSDAATNSLVVTANSADYQTLKKVIKKLDIPRLQVFIETAILEVAVGSNTKVGTNIALGAPGRGFAGGFIGDQAALVSAVSGGLPAEGATIPIFGGSDFSIPAQGSTPAYTVSTLMGLVTLLAQTTNTSVLQTPQIIALDNEKAEFQVLDEIPVVGSTTLATANSPQTQSIEKLKTGVVVKLTPHVNAASKTIRLEIEQKVDSEKDATSVPKALRDQTKAITTRVTNTSVIVKDQDYLMMGGLMSDKVDESETKVPLLGDIPILGWLFKSKNWRVSKTNLIILIRPKIIGTSFDAAALMKEKVGTRQEFIEKNFGGDDVHEEQVKKLDGELDLQIERSKTEPRFDYRNNLEEGDEPQKPQDQTQLLIPEESKPKAGAAVQPVNPAVAPETAPPPPIPLDSPPPPIDGGN